MTKRFILYSSQNCAFYFWLL